MILKDKFVYLALTTLFIIIVVFVVKADRRLSNMVDSCAPGLVLRTPQGWVCTEIIPR
jgi:hypothetical protein